MIIIRKGRTLNVGKNFSSISRGKNIHESRVHSIAKIWSKKSGFIPICQKLFLQLMPCQFVKHVCSLKMFNKFMLITFIKKTFFFFRNVLNESCILFSVFTLILNVFFLQNIMMLVIATGWECRDEVGVFKEGPLL